MADDESFTLELKGLNQLLKALRKSPPIVRIGVLGSGARSAKGNGGGKTPTNAEVGAVHEFGAPGRNIPQRSFLRVPLTDNLNKELEKSGLLDKHSLAAVIKSGTMVPWMEAVAICAEAVVDDAFGYEGPGWAAWKPGYTNQGGSILTDSGQLREAITSRVDE